MKPCLSALLLEFGTFITVDQERGSVSPIQTNAMCMLTEINPFQTKYHHQHRIIVQSWYFSSFLRFLVPITKATKHRRRLMLKRRAKYFLTCSNVPTFTKCNENKNQTKILLRMFALSILSLLPDFRVGRVLCVQSSLKLVIFLTKAFTWAVHYLTASTAFIWQASWRSNRIVSHNIYCHTSLVLMENRITYSLSIKQNFKRLLIP